MIYIGRRLDGSIYGSWTSPQPNDEHHPGIELVTEDHTDYVAFSNRRKNRIRTNPLAVLEARIAALEAR